VSRLGVIPLYCDFARQSTLRQSACALMRLGDPRVALSIGIVGAAAAILSVFIVGPQKPTVSAHLVQDLDRETETTTAQFWSGKKE
jgi:hypothetical protein